MRRVTGHADRDPAARNPMAMRNNRIELILLRTQR
jgi:chemotaxis protein MotB